MAKKEMDAVALLKADHRKVAGLFKKFESTKGAANECSRVVTQDTN